jgi:hypothetical protein
MSQENPLNARDELLEWSQPLIIDQINQAYFGRFQQVPGIARELAIEHYRIWRHVLRGELQAAAQLRRHLIGNALSAGIQVAVLDEIDRAVLDELMDVVVSRFRRTPHIARSYGMTLLDTATNLARTRQAAA